jgi:DNA-binding transcriptional MerR regulator
MDKDIELQIKIFIGQELEKGTSLSDIQTLINEKFNQRMNNYKQTLTEQFAESHRLEVEIMAQLDSLKFNG